MFSHTDISRKSDPSLVAKVRTVDVLSTCGEYMVDAPVAGQRVKVEVNSHNGSTTIQGVAPVSYTHLTLPTKA